jgi:predicted dehydrogenase
MAETVCIGVIGAGGIFRRRHFPALTDMDDVEIAAIANRSEESARSIAEEFGIDADPGEDPHAVIDREDVDAVMVGTWPYRHHPYAMAALDAGKHVFVQARMATDLREAKEMYARSEETGLVTQICPSPMGMRGDAVVQDLIADGYLGDLYFVRGQHVGGGRIDPSAPVSWRDQERFQGLNALAVGILTERLHRWVGHASEVSARMDTVIEERPAREGEGPVAVDLPDVVAVHCEFENGATGSLDFSNVAAHGPASQVELYGSEGTLVYDLDEDTLYGGDPEDDDLSEIPIPEEEAYEWTVEADFVDAIRNGGEPRTTFREGVKYMEFSEAVARSAETGGTVELPLRS